MKNHSIFWGIILFGGGILLVLNALGIGAAYSLVPMLGSLLLLAISVASFAQLNFVTGLLPLPIITYLWRDQLGLQDMNLWMLLLAALLLGIGLSSIFWKFKKKRFAGCCHPGRHGIHGDWSSADASSDEWSGETITSTDNSDYVDVDSTFGEHVKYVRSENLKKVKIDSNFSSVKVYFDQCKVSPEGATINIDCNFSGVVLYVPRSWNLNNQIHVFAGSVDGANMSSGDLTPVTLVGSVNFGNVKIVYL